MAEGDRWHTHLIVPAIERLLALQSGERVVDLGCGNGWLARRLARSGARVLGCDFSPTHLECARARATPDAEVDYRLMDLSDREQLRPRPFRNAGWRRLSLLGETMKYADLELEEPITRDRYQVQIKSAADSTDFAQYCDQFAGRGFRKLFFVVHSPTTRLVKESSRAAVELVLPARLSAMIVDAGLVPWILAKVR